MSNDNNDKSGITHHVTAATDTPVLNAANAASVNQHINAIALNKEFGLALYDRQSNMALIQFHLRQSAESMLEAGKLLIQMKENEEHGQWLKLLGELNIDETLANRLRKAAVKFANPATSQLLTSAAGNKSKLFELMLLDDEDIAELNDGGTVAGLQLDDVARMSTSELRAALRKQRIETANLTKSKDAVIQKKDQKLNELDHELEQLKLDRPVFAHVDWPEAIKGYVAQVAITRKNLKHALGSLDVLRIEAMKLEPQSPEEEASLTSAKEILATELVGIHNECLDMVEALGLSFDRSLGAYSEARIRLFQG